MMAHWDLDALSADLAKLATPLLLVVGDRDKAVPPEDARRVRRLARHAGLETMKGAGHLAHEERPEETAALAPPPAALRAEPRRRRPEPRSYDTICEGRARAPIRGPVAPPPLPPQLVPPIQPLAHLPLEAPIHRLVEALPADGLGPVVLA